MDAQIRVVTAEGGPTPLDLLRMRRARARLLRELAALLTRSAGSAA